jgi:hypothetical protein
VITTNRTYPWSFVTQDFSILKDRVVITTNGTYPWSFVTQDFSILKDREV